MTPVMDFYQPRQIGKNINHRSLNPTEGYNHPYLVDGEQVELPVATLLGEQSQIKLTFYSDYPTLVFYSGNITGQEMTNFGAPFFKHEALALECQFLPNAINEPLGEKKTGQLLANSKYRQQITYHFSVDD